MTEEEAFALDEYYTNSPPGMDPSKARIRIPMVRVDGCTAEYFDVIISFPVYTGTTEYFLPD
jgi:hypothetical protein